LRKRRQPPSARTGRGRRKGNRDLYEELFADDLVDHTPQPGTTPDKNGVRVSYIRLRAAFPDFRPEIHWQVAAGDPVTTYKTYHGIHQGDFLGIAATGQQLGVVPPLGGQR
jgi:predicted ester cyclase